MENFIFSNVEIKDIGVKGRGVFSKKNFKKGETVIVGKPDYVAKLRTKTSVQVDVDKHMEFQAPVCFLNHSCEPNTGVHDNEYGGYDFVALRDIEKSEEISFDYETTEYISIAIEECFCGAKNCRKKIKGYKFLEKNERDRYKGFIPSYLRSIGKVSNTKIKNRTSVCRFG